MLDKILSYREMCDEEKVQTLQRGMSFRINPQYSLILMSRRSNAPYQDKIYSDGITIEYEGHDEPKTSYEFNPKTVDQPKFTKNGTLTQNGRFTNAAERFKNEDGDPEIIKVYEKINLIKNNQSITMLAPTFVLDFKYPNIIGMLRYLGFNEVTELTYGAR
jgi:hypothetical protein